MNNICYKEVREINEYMFVWMICLIRLKLKVLLIICDKVVKEYKSWILVFKILDYWSKEMFLLFEFFYGNFIGILKIGWFIFI